MQAFLAGSTSPPVLAKREELMAAGGSKPSIPPAVAK